MASESAKKIYRLYSDTSGLMLKRSSAEGEAATEAEEDENAAGTPEASTFERLSTGMRLDFADQTIQLALDNANLILSDPDLNGAAKLYGMALLSGQSAFQARQLVQTKLVGAGGVQIAALASGVRALTGMEQTGATVTEQVGQINLMEEIVGLVLGGSSIVDAVEEEPAPAPAPPPDPRDHSVVIIGGSRVGAINNVTTAGVHVHDAKQSIENNL
jgi:hypothetical protein